MVKNFRWCVSFEIKEELSKDFQLFMEGTHFKTIHRSGCFNENIRKIFQPSVKPGIDSLVYIHEPKNEASWENYCNNFRDEAKKEFGSAYGTEMANGNISAIQSTGELEVIMSHRL